MSITTYAELRTALSNWLKRDTTIVADARLKEFVTLAEDRIYTDLRVRAMEAHVNITLKKAITVTTVSGTNTVVLTPTTAATGYALGDRYSFKVVNTNTGATTVNVSGQGATSVYKGETATDELEANDWIDNDTVEIIYNGTSFIWVPRGGYPLPSRYIEQRRLFLDTSDSKKLDFMTPEQFWLRNLSTETGQPKVYTIEGPHIIFGPSPDTEYFAKFVYFRRFAAFSADADTNWILTNAPGIYFYASLVEAALFLGWETRALIWSTAYDERVAAHAKTFQDGRFPRGRRVTRSEVTVV